MSSGIRTAATVIAVIVLVFSFGCSSSGPKATTAPATEVEATPTPVPTPVVEETVIPEGGVETVVSEQASSEELPADLATINARGYLDDVFFDTDSYQLDEAARDHLTTNAAWLTRYPSVKILIEGHCDERNTREYNLALGERRANSVRDYLIFMGVGADRIRTISYGEEKPFALGHDEAAWSQNRRAHFVITAR